MLAIDKDIGLCTSVYAHPSTSVFARIHQAYRLSISTRIRTRSVRDSHFQTRCLEYHGLEAFMLGDFTEGYVKWGTEKGS